MAQGLYKPFVSSSDVQSTMQGILNLNIETIITKTSGASEPTPTSQFMWWADTTSGILKMRDEADADWINVYDFDNNEVIINDDQITAIQIADAARKPTIIEGEDIGPATCAIKTQFTGGATPWLPIELFSSIGDPFGVLQSAATWEPLISSKIWIDSGIQRVLVTALMTTCSMRVDINGILSAEVGPATIPAWSAEASVDVSTLSGLYDFSIDAFSTQGLPGPYGGILGVSSRFSDV